MMRDARPPQATCGQTCASTWSHGVARGGGSLVWLFACWLLTSLPAPDAHAQFGDGTRTQAAKPSSFPKLPDGPAGKFKRPDTGKPLHLQADQLVYDTSGDKVVARGNVEIFFDNNILTADEVIYDQTADTLEAVGNVFVKDPNGNVIRADRYKLTADFRDGFVQQLSAISRDDTRIAAQEAVRRDGNVTEFRKGKFSPCKSESGMPPLWCIGASRIIHDAEAASITYQDAQFELLGVPVLYLPYFQHADPSVKRRTGFLLPGVSFSDTLGFTTEVPYHIALNPSYDILFNPLYTSKHGVLWQGTWRHRLANGEYQIKFAGIDQDAGTLDSSVTNPDDLDGWRGSIETKGKFSLGSWWSVGWDAIFESDDSFRRFYKLDSALLVDRVNQVNLTGLSERNYFSAKAFHFGGLTFSDTNDTESVVHPIIDHNYVLDDVLGGELRWSSNALQFGRENIGGTGRRQDVSRAITELKWRRRLTDNLGISYTPFGELRGDIYQLTDFIDPTAGGTAAQRLQGEDTVARGRISGGVMVAYPWVANSPSASHVIEPIGQIIGRTASVNQRALPNEDARSLVFDDSNLFDTDKFSGYDRLETGTRANVGVQYTFQANTGGYARLLVGQSFHLGGTNPFSSTVSQCNGIAVANAAGFDADCRPIFNPASGLASSKSDYVLGVYLAPVDAFRIISQTRFDEQTLDVNREELSARLDLGPGYVQAVYSYATSDPVLGIPDTRQDILGIVGLNLTDNWSVAATLRYDIESDFRLSDSVTIKYTCECFVLTGTYSESFYNDPTRDIVPDRTFFLRFELKHLGEYGYKTNQLDFLVGDQQQERQ